MPVYEERDKVNGQRRYYIRTYVEDTFGNRKQITKHNKKWIGKEGQWMAQQEELKLKHELHNAYEKIIVTDLVDKKLDEDCSHLKQSTIIRYKEFLKLYIKPYFKNKIADKLTTRDIIDWHRCLEKISINIESKRKIHNLLKNALTYGVNYYGLQKNVCELVGNFKNIRGTAKREMEILTIDEFRKFIECEENQIYKDFLTLLFYTGMRRGELLALCFSDIDFNRRIIKINKSINPKNGKEATVPKTNKANREIPLLSGAYEILKRLKKCNNTDLIFGLDKIAPSTLTRKCNNNCIKAGINKHIRVHDLRHSFVTLCLECGVKIEKISEYVGHENISTTYDVYGHLYSTAKLELVNMVDSYLEKQDQKQDQNILNPSYSL